MFDSIPRLFLQILQLSTSIWQFLQRTPASLIGLDAGVTYYDLAGNPVISGLSPQSGIVDRLLGTPLIEILAGATIIAVLTGWIIRWIKGLISPVAS